MAQQQLYTEEQVREMLQICQDSDLYEDILTFDDILKTQVSIELPNDEEIKKYFEWVYGVDTGSAIYGAKWMRDKILNKGGESATVKNK